jgi:hypothetical protein
VEFGDHFAIRTVRPSIYGPHGRPLNEIYEGVDGSGGTTQLAPQIPSPFQVFIDQSKSLIASWMGQQQNRA